MNIDGLKLEWDTMFDKNLISIDYWKDTLYLNESNSNKIISLNSNGKNYKYLNNNKFNMFSLKNIVDNVIINDLLFSIDGNLDMCRIFSLNEKKPIAIFGFKNMNSPSVIDGFFKNNVYHIFVNDSNNIIKYEIIIQNDKIVHMENYNFISFEGNIKSILIDRKYKKFYIANSRDLIIYDTNGNYLKSIKSIEPFKLKLFNEFIFYVDTHDDGNSINVISRKNQNKIQEFYSKKRMNIIDFTFDNSNYLYTLNDSYLISKIKIEQNLNLFYPVAISLAAYLFFKNPF